jgi:hypothetical protein
MHKVSKEDYSAINRIFNSNKRMREKVVEVLLKYFEKSEDIELKQKILSVLGLIY